MNGARPPGKPATPVAAKKPVPPPGGRTAAGQTRARKPTAPKQSARRSGFPRLRLIPLTIFVAVLFLGVRVGDLWTAVSTGVPLELGSPSIARQEVSTAIPTAESAPAAAVPVPAASSATPAAPAPPTRVQVAADPHPPPAAAPPAATPQPAGTSPAETPPSTEEGPDEDRRFTAEDLEVLNKLRERRRELEERERQLEMRAAFIDAAEQKVNQKIAELQSVRAEIQKLLNQVDAEQEAQFVSLVKIYETMKPKEAARIFDAMENHVLLNVVSRMKESKVAPVIAAMQVERAKEITKLLAERKQLPSIPE